MTNLVELIGRFHPLLVHLPIGFLLLLAVIELLATRPRFHNIGHSRGIIITLAALAAVASATCGWLLARDGGYDPNLVQWHKRLGIAVAVASVITAFMLWRDYRRLYLGALTGTLGLLMVASHLGGSLTHGSDFLTAPFYTPPAPITKPMEAKLYEQLVQPILQKNCYSCHGPAKQLDGIRLDSRDALVKGNKEGPLIQPGQSAASRIIRAVRLPLDHKEHMPPTGKPQPSPREIALIQWWIDAGAPTEKTVAELKPSGAVQRLLENLYAPPEPPLEPHPFAEIQPVAAKLSVDLGIIILPIAADQPWLQANAGLVKTFSDADLARLAPLAANLRWLDLGDTSVTDTGLTQVATMKNLTRLHLEQTTVTDAGLAALAPLQQLDYLNLYGTHVTDAGLDHLRRLSALHKVYLWQTAVTTNGVLALQRDFSDDIALQTVQSEIKDLQSQLATLRVEVNDGIIPTATVPVTPINTKCPVSGKPIDPTKTVTYKGKVIGFCCDKCIAAFNKNPKACLAKLGLK